MRSQRTDHKQSAWTAGKLTKSHVILVLYTIGLKRGTPFRIIELSKALKLLWTLE